MPDSSSNIREDLFQKQHAEAMQGLVWALSVAQKKQQDITTQEKDKIKAIEQKHKVAFEKEAELQAAMNAVNQRISNELTDAAFKNAIVDLKKHEQAYLEDLERKATRHKLSLFFAFFMAVGCGATLAGSNFLMGIEYNWIANLGFLSMLSVISLPIIIVVSMANWWLGVRAVPDLENKNRDPYKLSERFLGEYVWWKAVPFAISIFFIEIYNALTFNFQQSEKEKEEEEKNKRWYNALPVRLFWYLTVFLGAVIYAFFAFAATYDMGMGFLELFRVYGLAGTGPSSFLAAASISSAFGILMAVPTYITMKIIYFVSAKSWMTPGAGPLSIIEQIPGWEKPKFLGMNLKQSFIFFAALIVLSVGFMTYAAVDPLSAWFTAAGMSSGTDILATVTIAIAFIGNIPFYVNSAAKSFKQLFDPREQLQANNSKWFPYIRFWNATLNALPAIVGVLAFLGLLGISGPGALLLPIALNVLIGGAASYFANSNGTPTMYKFDAAKQISKYQLSQLDKLEKGEKIIAYEDMSPDQQLGVEYYGAQIYLREGNAKAKMPVLATALNEVLKSNMLTVEHEQALYHAFNPTFVQSAFRVMAQSFSAFAHGNVRYTKYLFPKDYLSRIEHYATDDVKRNLYNNALMGGKEKTASYRALLNMGPGEMPQDVNSYLSGNDAELFWKAYSVRDIRAQEAIISNIPTHIKSDPQVQERLMQYSRPETRKIVVKDIVHVRYLHDDNVPELEKWKGAYQLFHHENYFETNAITGFWAKNILFPVILLVDGVATLGKKMLTALGMGRMVANPLNLYDYLTIQADDETRKIFLCDVLCGYILQPSVTRSQFNVAEKLRLIILGDSQVQLSTEEVSDLKSGLIGCVFDIVISIPDVKARLATILDNTADLASRTVKEDSSSPERPSPAGVPVATIAVKTHVTSYDNYRKKIAAVSAGEQSTDFAAWVNAHKNKSR